MPPEPKRRNLSKWVLGIAGLSLLAVFAFLLLPNFRAEDDWERRISFAVDQAGNACLADVSETERRSIEAGVRSEVRNIGTKGETNVQTTRRAVDLALSEQGLLTERERVRACMSDKIPQFLGLNAEPQPAVVQNQPMQPANAAVPVREGYVYYEEASGQSTDHGVFGPIGEGRLAPYQQLQPGTILQARSTARLRAGPGKSQALRGQVQAGQCIRILSSPSNAVPTELATSGGHLHIITLSRCP